MDGWWRACVHLFYESNYEWITRETGNRATGTHRDNVTETYNDRYAIIVLISDTVTQPPPTLSLSLCLLFIRSLFRSLKRKARRSSRTKQFFLEKYLDENIPMPDRAVELGFEGDLCHYPSIVRLLRVAISIRSEGFSFPFLRSMGRISKSQLCRLYVDYF